jgi:hypothetical protein
VLTRRTALGALLAPLFLAGCGFGGGESYRYRMTVVVDTPEGPRSGSSVIEVRGHSTGPLAANAFVKRAKGEAVFVDLPGGRTLFALLSSKADGYDAATAYAERAYADVVPGSNWRRQFNLLKQQASPAELPTDGYPRFVTFANPHDARTVEVVDPTDLASVFGPGTSLRSITIAITKDDRTSTISSRLPDLGKSSGYSQWAARLPFEDPRFLTLNDFRRND